MVIAVQVVIAVREVIGVRVVIAVREAFADHVAFSVWAIPAVVRLESTGRMELDGSVGVWQVGWSRRVGWSLGAGRGSKDDGHRQGGEKQDDIFCGCSHSGHGNRAWGDGSIDEHFANSALEEFESGRTMEKGFVEL